MAPQAARALKTKNHQQLFRVCLLNCVNCFEDVPMVFCQFCSNLHPRKVENSVQMQTGGAANLNKFLAPYPWYMANLHKVEDHLLPGRPVFHQPEYFVNHHKQQQQFICLCPLKRLIYSQYTFETINIPSERFYKVEEHTAERSLGWNIFGEIIQDWWSTILHTKTTNYNFGKTMFFALKKQKHRLWWRSAISFTMAAMSA